MLFPVTEKKTEVAIVRDTGADLRGDGEVNIPIACSMVRNFRVKISPVYKLKNDTSFMKY